MTTNAIYPSLIDKHVLITGGGSGIGEALVRAFHAQKAQVSFIDINAEASQKLVAELGMGVEFYKTDLTKVQELQATIKQIQVEKGSIAILLNNAGKDTRYQVDEIDADTWDRMQAVNLRHVFFASQAVREGMKLLGGGAIINFTSTSFVKRSPLLTAYGTAKAAIIGLTRTLSRDLGEDNIRVNAIMPGWIMTERQKNLWLTPEISESIMQAQSLKEFIQPEEVGKLALFLASDESKMISAQTYTIDGGWV